MKILVIDDSPLHQASAHRTLEGHDLTVVGTYDAAFKLLCRDPFNPTTFTFDVVLCDLLMPAGAHQMAGEGLKYVGQEMPVGFALSLMAAWRGAKYVAVVTATNHHYHPASAMLDPIGSRCNEKGPADMKLFNINGSRVAYFRTPWCEDDSKDWGRVLQALIDDEN